MITAELFRPTLCGSTIGGIIPEVVLKTLHSDIHPARCSVKTCVTFKLSRMFMDAKKQ